MSIETWKAEFLSEVKEMPNKDALQHALKKWKGLKQKNLEKHGVNKPLGTGSIFTSDEELFVGSSTCVFCLMYADSDSGDCYGCPIRVYRSCGDGCVTQWRHWVYYSNPDPMIRRIQLAIRKQ